MERLIKLLNEYEKEEGNSEFYKWEEGFGGEFNLFRRNLFIEEGGHIYSDTADTFVISRKFGFIKWLVENDKIMVIDKEIGTSEEDYICGTKYRLFKECYSDYEILLMLLSISDSPIDDLISYLK